MRFRRRSLGIFLMFVGLMIFFLFNSYNKELERIEKEKNRYIAEKLAFKKSIIQETKSKIQTLAREQMRLNLDSTRSSVENISRLFDVDMTTYNNRIKLIKALTTNMYFYDLEGDTFTVNSNGSFEVDDSNDCGQPVSLLNPSLPLLNILNRGRTFDDEIAWQLETRFVLYSQGIIKNIDLEVLNSATENISPIKKYKFDSYLENTKIYRTKEIEYIAKNYPEVFYLLRKYKIIMHSEFSDVEKVNIFLNKQIDSDENTNLSWFFNPKPYEEILEIVWIPSGKMGFNEETKNYAGGTPNPNFIKIGLVQGTQMQKIYNEYSLIFAKIELEVDNDINTMQELYDKEKRNTEIFSIIITVLFLGLCFSLIQIILNKREW